jgi:acetolactate synthase-1/2/3 large subunit
MNGAQSLLKALVDAGISTCFANPGTSEMQLVYEMGRSDSMRAVLCLQEDVVTGAADGYGRMAGQPAFTLLHVGSGFANGIAMLHNAGRAHTPIVNVVGANASYHQPNFPEHELVNGNIIDLARAVSNWCHEARSASGLGQLGAEAAMLAKIGQVCTVIAPTNRHWEDANPPPPPMQAPRPALTREAVDRAAELLANGRRTGLVIGHAAQHGPALETAARIAARAGATLLSETFTSSRLERGAGRPVVQPIPYEFEMSVQFLAGFEQLILIGASSPVATFAYRDKPVMKSPAGCTLFEMANVSHDLNGALDALDAAFRPVAAADLAIPRHPAFSGAAPSGPLTAPAIGATLSLLMPENAVLVDEAATNAPWIFAATSGAPPHDYLNPLNGGAIGGGFPMALGAAIACPDRKTVLLQADGSGMYSVQALWTMAREKADVTVVLLRNDRYNILSLELARVRDDAVNARMESMLSLANPSIDWVRVAGGLGVPAVRADSAEGFHAAFEAAMGERGPRLIECIVPIPDEWRLLEEQVRRSRS